MTDLFVMFLRTAKLDVLELGMPPEGVASFLGSPTQQARSGAGNVWRYGPVELTLGMNGVTRIKLNLLTEDPPPVAIKALVLPSGKTIDELLSILGDLDISWQVDVIHTFDRQLCIQTEAGVRVFVDLDQRELQSAQVTTE